MSESSARTATRSDRFTDDASRSSGDTINLRAIIVTLRKYKWPIIFVTAIATALTALFVSTITPVYRATATLLFEQEAQPSFVNPLVGVDSSGFNYIQTQVEVLGSRTLAERIANEMKLEEHWEYNPTLTRPAEFERTGLRDLVKKYVAKLPAAEQVLGSEESDAPANNPAVVFDREQMVRQLTGRITVQPLKRTNLVRVSVDGVDRELATGIANEVGDSYIDHFLDTKDSRNREAFDWLDGKVVELKQKLEVSEAALLAERQRIGLTDQGSDLSARQVEILTTRLIDAKGQMEEAKILFDEVRSVSSAPSSSGGEVTLQVEGQSQPQNRYRYVGTPYESLPVVDSSVLVQRNKVAAQEAQRQLDELNNRYGSKHPRVIDAKSNLDTATNNLDRQISNVISSVENKYRAALANVRSIESELDAQKSRGYQVGRAQIKLVELEREVETNKLLYQEAYQRLREADEAEGLQTVNMSVTDLAAVPQFPVKPNKSLMVLLGFLLSLFGASALAFIYEEMKETVRGIQDVEKRLGLSVFGIVPMIKSGMFGRKSAPLIPGAFADKRGSFEEAIRTIRTGVTLTELEEARQVIMVTSSVPGEGKSTVASNLAFSFSKLDRTLLIEADMRRPGLGRALGIRNHGLSELLDNQAYLEDCLRESEIGDLDLIPAGGMTENPLELLASAQFVELLEQLKTQYDRIVIDLAPVQAVSDALIVGKYVDTCIYVIKADSTPLPIVQRGIDRLQEAGVYVSGTVVSQVDINKVTSYGGDYYYQGYYDYYGYGDKADSSSSSGASRARQEAPRRNDGGVTEFRRRDPIMRDGDSNVA
jgi:capsular exopolysaccharide synthesis family protein